MITAILLAVTLVSPKGAQLFPVKAVVLPPPGPAVVLKMPTGFDWSKYEVQLEAAYDLDHPAWTFVGFMTNGVAYTVPDKSAYQWYRLRAIPK